MGAPLPADADAAPDPLVAYSETSPSAVIHWPQALPAAAIAGLVAASLMLVPLGALGLGMIFGGVLSVVLYRRRAPFAFLTTGVGARLGALSGALGFGIFAIFTSIEVVVFHSGGELRAALLDAVQQSASRSPDPQAQQMLEYLKTPAGLVLVMGLGLVVMFFVFLIFSSVGGALGAAWLNRKDRVR